jgi:hypothetical protein
MLEMLED